MTAIPQRMAGLFQQAFPFQTLHRDIKIMFISNIFASFGDGLTIYLLPLFIRNLNATPENVGFLYSVLTLASAVTLIPGGFLADRYDRKKILLFGWALWVPVPLLFAFATNWTQLPPAMFLYGVLLSGPASSAYIVGRTKKNKMASTFTFVASGWAIGYTFAPTVAGFLAEKVGMQWVFFLTTVFYFITLVTLTRISSQYPKKADFSIEDEQTTSKVTTFNPRRILALSLLFAGVMFFLSLVNPFITQFLSDFYHYDLALIGVLGSVNFLGGATISFAVGKIGDRHGKTASVSVAMISAAVALGLFISFNNYTVLTLSSFLRGATFPMWALIGATIGSIAPSASRGRWISMVQTTTQVVSILAPYLGGLLYASSPQTPFLITIVASLVLSLLAQVRPFKE